MDSADLALNAVVLGTSATRALVPRHVHTHHMLASGEMLHKKQTHPTEMKDDPHYLLILSRILVYRVFTLENYSPTMQFTEEMELSWEKFK